MVVVVEGGGAVVGVVVDVVTAGALGVEADEQPASTKALPTTTDAVLAEIPRRVCDFGA